MINSPSGYRPGLVSVIIPNYGHARYLEQRIESVLQQSYPHFEVILLDDHSLDGSRQIIERYRHHPRVAAIRYNNRNSGSTFRQWQRGFALAQGEFIWIAESDDYAERHFLERCMEPMRRNPRCVMAYTESFLVDHNSRPIARTPRHAVLRSEGCDLWEGAHFVRRNMLLSNVVYNASMVLFRRSALPVDPTYTTFRLNGDWLFWCEVALCGEVAHLSERCNYFRQQEGSVTAEARRTGIAYREQVRLGEILLQRLELPTHTRWALEGRLLRLLPHASQRLSPLRRSSLVRELQQRYGHLRWKRLWYQLYLWLRIVPRIR